MMKNSLFILFFFATTVVSAQKTIAIRNTLSAARNETVVEIPWQFIKQKFPNLDSTSFKVINAKTKEEYPYQFEYKGLPQIQNLLVQLNIQGNSSVQLTLIKGNPKPVKSKTYCRFVPERKDDFAWENDKIAFRMYGKTLENFPNEMAYGVDVWVKRTNELVVDKRYKGDKYHVDNGDGLDYYHVGRTLGAGGIAPYLKDTVWYSKNYRNWKILDNGPLRSSFQLEYDEWIAAGRKVKAIKTITLDAGTQMNKTEVQFEWDNNESLPVTVGIIKRKEAGEILANESAGILAYWEPQHGADGTTGVGCVFTTPVKQIFITGEQMHSVLSAAKGNSFIYYNGAAWDKAGKIINAKQWFQYLENFKVNLKHPLQVLEK